MVDLVLHLPRTQKFAWVYHLMTPKGYLYLVVARSLIPLLRSSLAMRAHWPSSTDHGSPRSLAVKRHSDGKFVDLGLIYHDEIDLTRTKNSMLLLSGPHHRLCEIRKIGASRGPWNTLDPALVEVI